MGDFRAARREAGGNLSGVGFDRRPTAGLIGDRRRCGGRRRKDGTTLTRPTIPNHDRPAPGERSLGHTVTVAAPAVALAIGVVLYFDPTRRLGLDPASALGVAANLGAAALFFGPAYAVLSPIVDLVTAWVRATPESERRAGSGDGGDGFLGIGDGDCGGDGCGD